MIEFLHPRLAGPGRLFAGSCPRAPFTISVNALREAGVTTVACLLEPSALPAALVEAYAGAGVSLLRFPIDDMGVPASGAEFSAFLQQIGARMAAGEGVYVHCLAGVGRTGLALACLLVLAGEPAAAAVAAVRARYKPEAVETEAQRKFVEAFRTGR